MMNAAERKPLIAFQGKFYTSLSQAAEDIGLAPTAAYRLKKKYNFTDEEVLQYYIEQKNSHAGKSARGCGRKKAVVIDGVTYSSYTDALRAYQIPRVTVTSRMQRKGVDFETALMELITPKENDIDFKFFFDPSLVKPLAPDSIHPTVIQNAFYQDLKHTFDDVYTIKHNNRFGFQFEFPLTETEKADCIILFTSKTLSFIAPQLKCCIQDLDELTAFINQFNQKTANCRIGYEDGSTTASWIIDLPGFYQKFLIKALAEFLNGCRQFSSGNKLAFLASETIPSTVVLEDHAALDSEQEKTYLTLKEELRPVNILKDRDSLVFSSPIFFGGSAPTECFVLYKIRSHIIIVPELISNVKETPALYDFVLSFNHQYTGCKIWIDGSHIGASWNVDGATKGFFANVGQKVLRRFIASSRKFVELYYLKKF